MKMANLQQTIAIFNDILNKELTEEIEMIQNMKETEKRSLQFLEELKESTFTLIFKISKFELYFLDKNNRFLTFYYNLLYSEFSNKQNDYIFFFDFSPISIYLHGCEKVVKANSDKKSKSEIQQESLFVGVTPFQPRSIYDKKLANDKNNQTIYSQQIDSAQRKQNQRKIFDNNSNNNNNNRQFFASYDGIGSPPFPVSNSLQNSGQNFFSQQVTRRSNIDVVQFESLSEQNTKSAKNQDIDEFMVKEDSNYTNSQFNNSSMHSSSSPKKRKQIFQQDFEIQEDFFETKSHKENNEKRKIDLNEIMMKEKERRDLIQIKTNFVIKFLTNTSRNQVNLNVQLPEIHLNQDTRDIKEILNYYKEFPFRQFLNQIAECFSKRDYQKVTSIIKKANFLKYRNGQYKINSSLQIQSLLRPLANSKNLGQKQGDNKQQKNSVKENYDIEKNQKDGLYLFDDDEDDYFDQNQNQNQNNNQKLFFTNIHSQNTDQDYIDLEDIKNLPNFPKEYQSLFSENRNNLPSRLEAIQEDPLEMIQTTYKSNTKQINLQREEGDLSKLINGRDSKLHTRLSLLRSKIQMYQIFNYYLYKKIAGQKKKNLIFKEKKIEFFDLLDEYIGTKQFNVCICIGSINIDAKDHFSPDENEDIINIQIPPGQMIINFNSNLTNKHTVSLYHFKMSTTSKFKAIKYMINRIKKMVDLSQIINKEDDEDYVIDF